MDIKRLDLVFQKQSHKHNAIYHVSLIGGMQRFDA
jgi:hypothetical protein